MDCAFFMGDHFFVDLLRNLGLTCCGMVYAAAPYRAFDGRVPHLYALRSFALPAYGEIDRTIRLRLDIVQCLCVR